MTLTLLTVIIKAATLYMALQWTLAYMNRVVSFICSIFLKRDTAKIDAIYVRAFAFWWAAFYLLVKFIPN
jgi:hypothetical protein